MSNEKALVWNRSKAEMWRLAGKGFVCLIYYHDNIARDVCPYLRKTLANKAKAQVREIAKARKWSLVEFAAIE